MKSIFWPFFLLTGMILPQASAQRDSSWLKQNDLGNRYEGSYSREVGNASIELVSFTAGFEAYEFGKKQQLKVKFYLPEGDRYFLKAEELRPVQYYWMQDKNTVGKMGWNLFDQWQTDARLKQLSVPSDNLGVLVRAGDRASRKVAPAIVYHDLVPDSLATYIAKFRLGQSIESGICTVYRGLFDKAIPTADTQVHKGKIRPKSGGSFFPILIPAQKLGTVPGWYTVVVDLAKAGGGPNINYSFCFYHQPL